MSQEIELTLVQSPPEVERNTDDGDIVQLADGRLLVVWADYHAGSFPEAPTRVAAMTSDDAGQSWGKPYTLLENSTQESLMCFSLLRMSSGDILFFYGRRNSNSDFQVFVRGSGDETQTWSDPVMVTEGDGYCVMINARVIELSSGRIIAPLERTDDCAVPNHVLVSTVFYSDDGGRSWTKSETDIACAKRGAMEPGVVELTDGRLLMIIHTELGQIYRSYSSDEGLTWTDAEPMGIAAAVSAHSAISRIPATGDLLLIWDQGAEGSPLSLTAAISSDEAETWHHKRDLEPAGPHTCAYRSVNFVGDRVLLTYWVTDKQAEPARLYMKFRSLPVEWLYAEQ